MTNNLIDIARDILNNPHRQNTYTQKEVHDLILAFLLYLDIEPVLFKKHKMAAYRSTNVTLREKISLLEEEIERLYRERSND